MNHGLDKHLEYACSSPHIITQHRAYAQQIHNHSSLINTEGVSPHCLQKLSATPLLVVLCKFPPEMLPHAAKPILGWRAIPKKLTQVESPFEVLPFFLEVLVASEFYFLVHLLHNKSNISFDLFLSTIKCQKNVLSVFFLRNFLLPDSLWITCTRQ